VRDKQTHLEKITKQIEEHYNRTTLMREHLKNVQSELVNTQSLQSAKENDSRSEQTRHKLLERERGKLAEEIKKLQGRQVEYKERGNAIQQAMVQAQERFEQFRNSLKMGKDQLEQWVIAKRQKDEDNLVMLR
jgi:coiled-coil domain-containing protein 39